MSVKTYAYIAPEEELSGSYTTTALSYGNSSNPDYLTRCGYKNIGYNAIGYPVTYGSMHFDWSNGKLAKYYEEVDVNSSSSAESVEFSYNALGHRIRKEYTYDPGDDYSGNFTIGKEVSYDYDHSGRLIREISTEYFTESASETTELVFLYDESGMIGFTYSSNGATPQAYYYHRNLQGDVVAIYNTSGVKVANYTYDAFGNCTASGSMAQVNPIRYRGYYWDSETKWYYLNARYYSPEWRRFISPDDTAYLEPESVNGLNLYCYCNNDPVNYADPSGHFTLPNWAKWVIGGIAFVGAVALTALTGGTLAPVFIGMASSVIFGGLAGGIDSYLQGEDFWSGFADGSANGAMWGGLSLLGGAAIRTFNIFKNGVVIGENMTRVKTAAKQLGGAQTYAGNPGFKILKAIKGEAYATTKALAHNKAWLTRMMNWGVKVYDIGIDIERTIGRSSFYALETALANSYWNMIPCYLI